MEPSRPVANVPLTVCHVFSGDLWAGAEVVIFNLLSSLQGEPGLRVIALALNEGELTRRLREAGVRLHVIPESRHNFLGLVRRAIHVLKRENIGVLHAHRYKENLLALLLAKRLGVRELVTTMHGLPEAPQNRGAAVRAVGLMHRLDLFIVSTFFSKAVAVSSEMQRVLLDRYGFREDRLRVIRNGGRFPDLVAAPGAESRPLHIGTVGRLVPIKGLDLFLEVAAAIRRQEPNVRFSILGDGPLREELGGQAVRLGIADRVEFMTPRPDPYGYYGSLDVYLNTSVHEGLPLSIVEAMACGKPIVSAAVGGIPEIVVHEKHGFLVQGRDPLRFAERCLTLMRDNRLRHAMGQDAAGAARSGLSAEAMARQYRALYEELGRRVAP